MIKGIDDSFHPAGHTELIENMKQMILDRVFAQLERRCDISVAQPFCQKMKDVLFACSEDR